VLAEAQPGAYALKRAVLLEKSFFLQPGCPRFRETVSLESPDLASEGLACGAALGLS